MTVVGRDALLGAPLRTEEVPLPELGNGTVARVRMMSAAQREQWEAAAFERDGDTIRGKRGQMRAYLVIFGVVDEHGAPLFGPEDLESVNRMPAAVVDRLAVAVNRLNGFNETEATLKGN